MAEPVQQNLAGLRVLDITQYIAGPTLGRILADLGAEVVKLEMPPGGEYSRSGGFPPRVEGQSPAYIYYNRGKRSICIDFKRRERREGATIVIELARHFDVVIESYTPGVLAKYGLAYEAFKAVNPRIIMCPISGFGQTGSRVDRPGNDMTARPTPACPICGSHSLRVRTREFRRRYSGAMVDGLALGTPPHFLPNTVHRSGSTPS
jgi:CoA:oxalate CoA-transferase